MMKAIKLTGSSMLPLFKDGETVLYRESPGKNDLKPGDCAVYRRGETLMLHRIVETGEAGAVFSNDDSLENHFANWDDVLGGIETRNPFKKGFAGLLFHKITRKLREAKCGPKPS